MPICVKVKCPHCEKEFDILFQKGKVEKDDKGYCTSCNNHIDILANCVGVSVDYSILTAEIEKLVKQIKDNETTNPIIVLLRVANICNVPFDAKL